MLPCQKKIQHRQRYFFMIAIQLSHKPFMESYMSFIIFIYAISKAKASRGACGFLKFILLESKKPDGQWFSLHVPAQHIFIKNFSQRFGHRVFLIWLKCLAVIFLLKTTYGFVQKPAISLLPIPFAFLGGLAPLISRTNQIYT